MAFVYIQIEVTSQNYQGGEVSQLPDKHICNVTFTIHILRYAQRSLAVYLQWGCVKCPLEYPAFWMQIAIQMLGR